MKPVKRDPGYLHGFTRKEQDRLVSQARFLEDSVYENVDFSGRKNLIEVGCGVGAQTEILLKRFPRIRISGVDASRAQIERARERLKKPITRGQLAFHEANALKLPFSDHTFDSAFLCWLLEHVENPVGILKEVRRTLKRGATIYCSEVLNSSLYLNPYSPATLQYWFAFNDYQWTIHGDPFVGARLGNYLSDAGFRKVTTEVKVFHYDNRTRKKRAEFIEYWTSLMLSGAPGMIKAGKVTPALVRRMQKELAALKRDPDAVFFYTWIQARAEA